MKSSPKPISRTVRGSLRDRSTGAPRASLAAQLSHCAGIGSATDFDHAAKRLYERLLPYVAQRPLEARGRVYRTPGSHLPARGGLLGALGGKSGGNALRSAPS